jgi:NADH/NAD ratio-sensing transcriptional regulator Rex
MMILFAGTDTRDEHDKKLFDHNIAIVGAGNFCTEFLNYIFSEKFRRKRPVFLGVADKDENATGLVLAKARGIIYHN